MRILVLEHEKSGVSADDFQPYLAAEAAKVYALMQADVIREIYFRRDRPEAVLMLECTDETEVRTILDDMPLVRAGLITFEVIPLRPYPGLKRLFAAEE